MLPQEHCFGGIFLQRFELEVLPLLPVLVPCAAAGLAPAAPTVAATRGRLWLRRR